jgi:uncharacterized membrane protein
MTSRSRLAEPPARLRLLVAAGLGLVVGLGGGLLSSQWQLGLLLGWMAAAALFVAWMWFTIGRMSPQATRDHACREDPGQAASDVAVLSAAVASLGAVGLFLAGGPSGSGSGGGSGGSGGSGVVVEALLTVLSVALAWATVHTVFTVRYARMYYVDSRRGIKFNQDEDPTYVDFAYLAFTVGMTFQVSDTDIRRPDLRAVILRHMLLSYLLGAVVIAVTINLVGGLSK